jgi:LSD1 subclass zinc finger protein
VDAIAASIPCPHCGAPLRAEPHAILGQVVAGREGQVGMFGSTGGIEGRFGTVDAPLCASCEEPLDLERALVEKHARCAACETVAPMRAVPPELAGRVPEGVTHIVGERFGAGRGAEHEGATPLVHRLYLWIDPHAQARAEAARRTKLQRRARLWIGVGLVLFCGGVLLLVRYAAAAFAPSGTLVVVRDQVLGWIGAGLLLLGAPMLQHGAKRFVPALELALGFLGLALLGAGGAWLYFKPFAPWAVVAAVTGFAWLVYLLRHVIQAM